MHKSEVAGNLVFEVNDGDRTITINSLTESFDEFTVGIPEKLIEFDCGHSFHTGADQSRFETDGVTARTKYHCIKCQREVGITSWEQ